MKAAPRIYVASKSEIGAFWQALRTLGVPIISTWIDECGEGENILEDLWERCVREACSATVVLAYHRPGDIWKGAFVEIGAALAHDVPVVVVGDPPGSWTHHRLVQQAPDLAMAIHQLSGITPWSAVEELIQ